MITLHQKADQYLQSLCREFPSRRVGNPANQAATHFFTQTMQTMGLETKSQRFKCMDHRMGEIYFSATARQTFDARISPHTLGCDLSTKLTVATNLEELRNGDFQGSILLLQGELTKEQLMPKNFVFYNPESHQEIYRLLESQQPAAIITATGKNPELAGAPYPFPLIEDGDFDIPSAYMTDVEGQKLAEYNGEMVTLKMDAERIPSWAENISVQLGNSNADRLVICAHIDSKANTPGAVDNGSGVIVLLLLAELLKEQKESMPIELLALNGEDHYSAGGEMTYLALHQGKMENIRLAINIDGAGYRGHLSEISYYSCSENIEKCARQILPDYPSIRVGEPWYQSDHMVFAMNKISAIALTTSAFMQMEQNIAHTPKDSLEQVDITLLVNIAKYLRCFIFQYLKET